jgi:hypothetical protein
LFFFVFLSAHILLVAFLLNKDKKERIAYTKWCEERGYERNWFRSVGHYCHDRNTGKTIRRLASERE